MNFSLAYPLFLVKHGGGYISLVDEKSAETPPTEVLTVFSDEQKASVFIDTVGIMAGIKRLGNSREFAWLLTSLQAPVCEVVLDPGTEPGEIQGIWRLGVRDLLNKHLKIDYSPWNYPVFAIREEFDRKVQGWSSISGSGVDGQKITAAAIFSGQQAALDYKEEAGIRGTLVQFDEMLAIREWIQGLAVEVLALAINPTVEKGVRKAGQCLAINKLLDDYLVEKNAETTESKSE